MMKSLQMILFAALVALVAAEDISTKKMTKMDEIQRVINDVEDLEEDITKIQDKSLNGQKDSKEASRPHLEAAVVIEAPIKDEKKKANELSNPPAPVYEDTELSKPPAPVYEDTELSNPPAPVYEDTKKKANTFVAVAKEDAKKQAMPPERKQVEADKQGIAITDLVGIPLNTIIRIVKTVIEHIPKRIGDKIQMAFDWYKSQTEEEQKKIKEEVEDIIRVVLVKIEPIVSKIMSMGDLEEDIRKIQDTSLGKKDSKDASRPQFSAPVIIEAPIKDEKNKAKEVSKQIPAVVKDTKQNSKKVSRPEAAVVKDTTKKAKIVPIPIDAAAKDEKKKARTAATKGEQVVEKQGIVITDLVGIPLKTIIRIAKTVIEHIPERIGDKIQMAFDWYKSQTEEEQKNIKEDVEEIIMSVLVKIKPIVTKIMSMGEDERAAALHRIYDVVKEKVVELKRRHDLDAQRQRRRDAINDLAHHFLDVINEYEVHREEEAKKQQRRDVINGGIHHLFDAIREKVVKRKMQQPRKQSRTDMVKANRLLDVIRENVAERQSLRQKAAAKDTWKNHLESLLELVQERLN